MLARELDEAPRRSRAAARRSASSRQITSSFSADRAASSSAAVEVGVLDDPARRLHERVDGEHQSRSATIAATCSNPKSPVHQEAGRVRPQLARDRQLEADEPLVGRVAAHHRAQRLALVHRDHREGAGRTRDRVE